MIDLPEVLPCSCHEHRLGALTQIKSHYYDLLEDEQGCWRWYCRGCERAGICQVQSPSVSYHQWLKHAKKS